MKAVIMAGGKGTRISSIASDIPKPMIKILSVLLFPLKILKVMFYLLLGVLLIVSFSIILVAC